MLHQIKASSFVGQKISINLACDTSETSKYDQFRDFPASAVLIVHSTPCSLIPPQSDKTRRAD